MKIFKLIQKNDRFGTPIEDFEGEVVLFDNSRVLGYLDEEYHGMRKYIVGKLYQEKNKMFFLKMVNDPNIAPLIFFFPDLDDDGYKYTISFHDFFFVGKRKIEIEELFTLEKEKEISKKFNEFLTGCTQQNMILMLRLDEIEKMIVK